MAKPVLNLYTEATDGSSVETKESALVWQYKDADPGFGFSQAKELLDHLESVLANEPVEVKSGQFIVEVKPQASYNIKPHVCCCIFAALQLIFSLLYLLELSSSYFFLIITVSVAKLNTN